MGIGIPEAALPHLGKRFYRAPNASARQLSGLELGLALVYEVIAAHGGTVEVASVEGAGTTIMVRLPNYTET
jgi:signal transduction histidine kinase